MEKIHITLKEGQKIFFTSDLHLGHRNVIRFCDRPFVDIKEMNQAILDNINSTVAENDYLFMLGDIFWFNDSHAIKKFFDQIVCKNIYIIPGNHDDFKGYHRLGEGRVKICSDITCLFLDKENDKTIYELWLSHFPMTTWPHREKNKRCYQLFGHIHSGEKRDKNAMDQDLLLHLNQFDVGVDNWNYKPVEVNEIICSYVKYFSNETIN